MAHYFPMLPPPPHLYDNPGRSKSYTPTMKHSQPNRSDSASSSTSSAPSDNSTSTSPISPDSSASVPTVRTYSYGPGAVMFERSYLEGPDEEIIMVPIKLENKFRKSSVDGAEELPNRPAPRTFLRRLSTRVAPRLDNTAAKEEQFKIVKMPRGEYRKFFRRDRFGKYAGTEEERKWDAQDLDREYAAYQGSQLGPRR